MENHALYKTNLNTISTEACTLARITGPNRQNWESEKVFPDRERARTLESLDPSLRATRHETRRKQHRQQGSVQSRWNIQSQISLFLHTVLLIHVVVLKTHTETNTRTLLLELGCANSG